MRKPKSKAKRRAESHKRRFKPKKEWLPGWKYPREDEIGRLQAGLIYYYMPHIKAVFEEPTEGILTKIMRRKKEREDEE